MRKSIFLCFSMLLLNAPAYAGFVSNTDQEFNAYVFGDFTLNSGSIQGGVAAKDKVKLKNYSIGHQLKNGDIAVHGGKHVSLVGGSVNGKVSAKGKFETQNIAPVNRYEGDVSLRDKDYFLDLSSDLVSSANGSVSMQWGRLLLEGEGRGNTLVINMPSMNWGQFWGLASKETHWDRVILNIPGVNVTMGYIDWLMKSEDYSKTYSGSEILYNFYEAETVTISGAVTGSILAPNADVIGNYGVIDGQLVADSFYGSIELRNSLFALEAPPMDVSARAPAVLSVISFFILMLYRKRKAKHVVWPAPLNAVSRG